MAGNDENAPRKLPLEMRGCSREWRLTGFVANSHYRPWAVHELACTSVRNRREGAGHRDPSKWCCRPVADIVRSR